MKTIIAQYALKDTQIEWITETADKLEMSESELLRMILDALMKEIRKKG